uniref:Malate dehydrogenase n=1 Tax=Steinernema glaseri TaxID=37863 RepID=A0A1I7Z406_9BILA
MLCSSANSLPIPLAYELYYSRKTSTMITSNATAVRIFALGRLISPVTCLKKATTSGDGLTSSRTAHRGLRTMASPGDKVVAVDEVRRFIVDCMTRVGTDKSHSEQLADVLVCGDRRGHYSHGLNRLDMYVRDVRQRVCKGTGSPKILKEKAASAWVDGNNLLGPVVGNFCMDLAMKKAKEAGVGWVVAKGSNHFGIAGWYTLKAIEQGMIGMSFTNTSPIMYPTRSSKAALGTNPLSLGAAGVNGDSFVLDMATTTVAIGKVIIYAI